MAVELARSAEPLTTDPSDRTSEGQSKSLLTINKLTTSVGAEAIDDPGGLIPRETDPTQSLATAP
jgi:hypothetical protein